MSSRALTVALALFGLLLAVARLQYRLTGEVGQTERDRLVGQARQCASALAPAHDREIVHVESKPQRGVPAASTETETRV